MYTLNNFYDFIVEATGRDFEDSTVQVRLRDKHSPLATTHMAFPWVFIHIGLSQGVASGSSYRIDHILKEFATIRAIDCSSASTNHSFVNLLTSCSHQFVAEV